MNRDRIFRPAPLVVSYFNHRDNHRSPRSIAGGVHLNFIMYIGETYKRDPNAKCSNSNDTAFRNTILGTKGVIEADV